MVAEHLNSKAATPQSRYHARHSTPSKLYTTSTTLVAIDPTGIGAVAGGLVRGPEAPVGRRVAADGGTKGLLAAVVQANEEGLRVYVALPGASGETSGDGGLACVVVAEAIAVGVVVVASGIAKDEVKHLQR